MLSLTYKFDIEFPRKTMKFEQPGERAAEGKEAMNIEELRAAQVRHEADTAEERRQKEEKELHEQELRVRTDADMEPRETAIAQSKSFQAEIDKLKAEKIEERIANSEKLKESQAAKEQEFQSIQIEFSGIEAQIKEIQALIEGKSEEEIAVAVKDALAKVNEKKALVGKTMQGLTSEIGSIKAGLVSDQEIQKYRKLQEDMENLNTQVAQIEANPYMVERLFEEAKDENEIRDAVVREALGGTWRKNPKEAELIREVSQKFLTEEFVARGIDKIKDRKEREEAMGQLAKRITEGVAGGADQHMDYQYAKKDQRIGFILKRLVGKHGTMDGQLGEFEGATDNFQHCGKDVDTKELIARHLGSMNLVRGWSMGTETYKRNIMDEYRFQWDDFDRNVGQYGFDAHKGNAIVSKDVDRNVAENIEAEFQKNIGKAHAWEKQMLAEEKRQLNTEIPKAEQTLKQLKESLKNAERAQSYVERLREKSIYSKSELENTLAKINGEISSTEKYLEESRAERESLGTFSFGKKRELGSQISSLEQNLRVAKEEKSQVEKDTEAFTVLEKARPYKIEEEIDSAESNLNRLRNRLGDLDKVSIS